jgi:hypothetical protein
MIGENMSTTLPLKTDRLVKLANKRVPKAIKAIQLIGNLSTYGPTDKQAETILNALGEALNAAADRFKTPAAKKSGSTFTL